MPIIKVDSRIYLESGTLIVTGERAAFEVQIPQERVGHEHVVAIKFRSDGGKPVVRFGTPNPHRTVVHLANLPIEMPASSDGEEIGLIAGQPLVLAFKVEPLPGPSPARKVTFTLYGNRAPV